MNKSREKLGYLLGAVSIGVNLFLFILKFWAGKSSGSIALIADAWHTLSDSISSLILIVAVWLAARKPDREHPFGHGRWEEIAAVFIAFFLGIIAFDFSRESLMKFKAHESAEFGTFALVITILSVVIKEALARYGMFVAKKTRNSSIKADAWHHRMDAVSSLVILVGILLKDLLWWTDSVLGLIISLLLFYAVYDILKEAINKLLGERISDEMINEIRSLVRKIYPEGIDSHHFHIHSYGAHKELIFHIRLDGNMSLLQAHQIATHIEEAIDREYGIRATIHVEPETD